MKKLLLFTFMFMFAFQSMSFAAIGGSKGGSSAPKSSPSISQPAPSSSGSLAPKSSTSEYKPSAPASSYSDKAPAAAAKPQQQAAQQSTGSSFLRNVGLFGGGMLLGSMLGHMFGFGSTGMMSDIIGMLFNVVFIGLIFMALRYAWNRYQESKADKERNNRRWH